MLKYIPKSLKRCQLVAYQEVAWRPIVHTSTARHGRASRAHAATVWFSALLAITPLSYHAGVYVSRVSLDLT